MQLLERFSSCNIDVKNDPNNKFSFLPFHYDIYNAFQIEYLQKLMFKIENQTQIEIQNQLAPSYLKRKSNFLFCEFCKKKENIFDKVKIKIERRDYNNLNIIADC